MYSPQVADRPCGECQKYFYKPTGEKMVNNAGLPVLRAANQKPSCQECPKQSPEIAPTIELTPENRIAYAFSLRAIACGLPPEWEKDSIVRRNISIVHQMHVEFERRSLAAEIASNLRALKL